jgi:hypothetical protein
MKKSAFLNKSVAAPLSADGWRCYALTAASLAVGERFDASIARLVRTFHQMSVWCTCHLLTQGCPIGALKSSQAGSDPTAHRGLIRGLGGILEQEGKKENDGKILHLPARVQVALMATQALPELQVTARRRNTPVGTYTYRITKSDNPTWFEESANPYPTREAAPRHAPTDRTPGLPSKH